VSNSHDGRYMISGSADRSVKIWDVLKKKEVCSLIGHSGQVISVGISIKDEIVSCSGDKSICIWKKSSLQWQGEYKIETDRSPSGLNILECHNSIPNRSICVIGNGGELCNEIISNGLEDGYQITAILSNIDKILLFKDHPNLRLHKSSLEKNDITIPLFSDGVVGMIVCIERDNLDSLRALIESGKAVMERINHIVFAISNPPSISNWKELIPQESKLNWTMVFNCKINKRLINESIEKRNRTKQVIGIGVAQYCLSILNDPISFGKQFFVSLKSASSSSSSSKCVVS